MIDAGVGSRSMARRHAPAQNFSSDLSLVCISKSPKPGAIIHEKDIKRVF